MLAVINPTLSARVGADPVHKGNQRFETLEYTREDWALPKYQDEYNGLIKAPIFNNSGGIQKRVDYLRTSYLCESVGWISRLGCIWTGKLGTLLSL